MKAVNRFKSIVEKKRPRLMDSILGGQSRMVQPPLRIRNEPPAPLHKSKSLDAEDRRSLERVLVTEGVHRKIEVPEDLDGLPAKVSTTTITPINEPVKADTSKRQKSEADTARRNTGRGHAHDPMQDHVFIDIGPGGGNDDSQEGLTRTLTISESPGAVDHDVFAQAYKDTVEEILEQHQRKGTQPSLYMTRRVEHEESIRQ
jgi:[calcium/calmodulin-dependent protein kinase] kinase